MRRWDSGHVLLAFHCHRAHFQEACASSEPHVWQRLCDEESLGLMERRAPLPLWRSSYKGCQTWSEMLAGACSPHEQTQALKVFLELASLQSWSRSLSSLPLTERMDSRSKWKIQPHQVTRVPRCAFVCFSALVAGLSQHICVDMFCHALSKSNSVRTCCSLHT